MRGRRQVLLIACGLLAGGTVATMVVVDMLRKPFEPEIHTFAAGVVEIESINMFEGEWVTHDAGMIQALQDAREKPIRTE